MKQIKSLLFLILILGISSLNGQGLVSHHSNDDGTFLQLGAVFIGKKMLFTNQKIQTTQLSVTFPGGPPITPTSLQLNPDSGAVTIGDTENQDAKLTIRADDEVGNQPDLHLEGTGIVTAEKSFFFKIDENNDADEYFAIENSVGDDLFWIAENGYNYMRGNLAIGDQIINKHANGFKLSVDGKIMSEEVRVELDANWPDYVFTTDYDLLPLDQLEKEISRLGHLPGIPAAEEVESEGFELGNMNRLLLEKIEELTLHVIGLHKEIQVLKTDKLQN